MAIQDIDIYITENNTNIIVILYNESKKYWTFLDLKSQNPIQSSAFTINTFANSKRV